MMQLMSALSIIQKIKPFTCTSDERINNLISLIKKVDDRGIEGSLVECGVWKCGMVGLMSLCSYNRKIFGFDSFEGMPEPSSIDGPSSSGWRGQLLVSLDEAEKNLSVIGATNVNLVKGLFDKTLPAYKKNLGKIAILRLDGDWYESTMTCLNELYDLVEPGGYVIIDDYGHWAGCKKATDEFRMSRRICNSLVHTDYTEVWWQK